MSRVLDAETVVVGMRPAVAITLVELGLSLPGVRTALNVERGMAMLQASVATSIAAPVSEAANGHRDGLTSSRSRRREDVVRVAPGGPRAWRRRARASASSIRPRSSPPPASWRATRWSTAAAARCELELLDRRRPARRAADLRGPRARASPTSSWRCATATPPATGLGLGSGRRAAARRTSSRSDRSRARARVVPIVRWK